MTNELTYPLKWPIYRERAAMREVSKFKPHSINNAYLTLLDELRQMRAEDVVITTNIRLRVDGSPILNQAGPIDPGAAAYFKYGGRPIVLCCDKWETVADNLWAISLTVEAMRGIDRWGATNLTDTFTGYLALPAPEPTRDWWLALDVSRDASADEIRAAYRALAKKYHPDTAGAAYQEDWHLIQAAYDAAMKERGL